MAGQNEDEETIKMADEQKRVTTEEAFHQVAETIDLVSKRIDNQGKRLDNHDETLQAMATLVDMLRTAVIDLQVRAGLKPHDPGASN
jgi:two-component sensor histidine kinase